MGLVDSSKSPYLIPQEACDYLRITRATLYNLVYQQKLQPIRMGKGKLQAIVGHKDLKTTMSYIRLCGADLVGATDSLVLDLSKSGQLVDLSKTKNI